MTTPRGQAPLSKTTTPNGHGDPSPRSAAAPKAVPKTAAKTALKAAPKAAANGAAQGPAPKPLSVLNIFGVRETVGALRYFGQVATRHPQAVLQTVPGLNQELVKIGLGRSEVAPEKGDKRFADPAWQGNPLFKATMQSYLTWGAGLERYVDRLDLPGKATARLRFGAVLLREAMAPTNFFAANPAAVKRAYDTGGGSVRRGLANWLGDLRHNHGMPTMVDPTPFTKGENLAATPGSVIYRNEVFELIQYTPQAETVYDRPLLVVPPQVNKYYALDLSPGRSMYEYLLQRGIQVYTISWRNPTKAHRDWDFDTYVEATIDATDVIRQVSGSPDVNIMGACLGGMTSTLAQAHLQAVGDDRIHSSTLLVTLLDTDSDGRMFLFATPQLLEVAKQVSKPTGIINGWQLGNTFAWLRPNDLVLELLGQQLPDGPGPAGLRHPGLEQRHHPAEHGLPPADAGDGGGEPDDPPRGHEDHGHPDRPVGHHFRHVRGGRADRPHHPVEDLLPVHPGAPGSLRVRAVLQRPHPDRGGRPEAPRYRLLRQPGHAAQGGGLAGGRRAARRILVGPLGRLAGRALRRAERGPEVAGQHALPAAPGRTRQLHQPVTAVTGKSR